jgi:hypothetical protein
MTTHFFSLLIFSSSSFHSCFFFSFLFLSFLFFFFAFHSQWLDYAATSFCSTATDPATKEVMKTHGSEATDDLVQYASIPLNGEDLSFKNVMPLQR